MIIDSRSTAEVEEDGWLTTVLRPAGTLNRPALDRLSRALTTLAASSDMVIVDLTAAHVAAPGALARTLHAPAVELQQPGRCLLLIGAPPDLLAELDRAAVRVAVLDDAPPASTPDRRGRRLARIRRTQAAAGESPATSADAARIPPTDDPPPLDADGEVPPAG
jgi:hypothetical protein